jgi:type IV pilus assembly protein PilZ
VELRRFSRAPIQQLLLFAPKDEDGFVEGTGNDISLGGMFVATEFPAPFNTEITIHTRLDGVEGEFVLPAIVRWRRPDGMGVQFGPLGARETLAISEIVRRFEESRR